MAVFARANAEPSGKLHCGAGAALGAAALLLSQPGPHRAEEPELERPAPVDEMGYVRTVVRGVPQPPFIRDACLEELQRDFALRGDDIVVATYPKCGTTWMQQILLTLLFGGEASKAPRAMQQAPWIESSCCRKRLGLPASLSAVPMSVEELLAWDGRLGALDAPPRRVFKTHAQAGLVPWRGGVGGCGGAKVVVVTRNPKDACVSNFHHARDVVAFAYCGDLWHFVTALFLRGRVESGCFWEWHAGWEAAAAQHPGDVMWVSYEELKRDYEGTVRRLAGFLQIPAPDDVIARTMAASSFASMKVSIAQFDGQLTASGVAPKRGHLRKGEMGSWRGDIEGALLAEFDAVSEAKTALHGLKYKFDYGDP